MMNGKYAARLQQAMHEVDAQRCLRRLPHIRSPQEESLLATLEGLMSGTREERLLLISAPARAGMTTILRRFAEANPTKLGPEVDRFPVVYLDSPPSARIGPISKSILRRFGTCATIGREARQLLLRLETYLVRCQTNLLILDHSGNLLDGRIQGLGVLDLLEELLRTTKVRVVLAGSNRFCDTISNHPSLRGYSRRIWVRPFTGNEKREFIRRLSDFLPSEMYKASKAHLIALEFDITCGYPGHVVDSLRKEVFRGGIAENVV